MMRRIDREMISQLLGDEWDSYLPAPEPEKRPPDDSCAIDSDLESRNNNN